MYTDYLYKNSYKSYNIDYVREDDDIILESKNVEKDVIEDLDKKDLNFIFFQS